MARRKVFVALLTACLAALAFAGTTVWSGFWEAVAAHDATVAAATASASGVASTGVDAAVAKAETASRALSPAVPFDTRYRSIDESGDMPLVVRPYVLTITFR